MFVTPPPKFTDHVIDHADIYQECEQRYGKPIDLAIKSTFNPKTNRLYCEEISPERKSETASNFGGAIRRRSHLSRRAIIPRIVRNLLSRETQ